MSDVVAVCKFKLFDIYSRGILANPFSKHWMGSVDQLVFCSFAWTCARLIRNIVRKAGGEYYPLAGKRRVKWGLSTLSWFSQEEDIEYGSGTANLDHSDLSALQREEQVLVAPELSGKSGGCSQCSSSFQSFPSGNTFNSCPLPKSQILTVLNDTERPYK